jgi:hypothetical protein
MQYAAMVLFDEPDDYIFGIYKTYLYTKLRSEFPKIKDDLIFDALLQSLVDIGLLMNKDGDCLIANTPSDIARYRLAL